MRSNLFLGLLPALVLASPLEQRDCNHDNCYRAVLASAYPTRHGLQDCMSYLEATTTSSLTTVTATVHATGASTVTVDAGIFTTDSPVTVTKVVDETVTVTVSTETVFVKPTGPDGSMTMTIKKRATLTSEASHSIPTYASACSGAVKYSSACSCMGASVSTTTLPGPTTTTTTTVYSLPPYISTIYDATVSGVTTVATAVQTTTAATVSATATVTINAFAIEAASGSVEGQYLELYSEDSEPVGSSPPDTGATDFYYVGFGAAFGDAARWFFDPSGDASTLYSFSDEGDVFVAATDAQSLTAVVRPSYASNIGGAPAVCSVDSDDAFTCHEAEPGEANNVFFVLCRQSLLEISSQANGGGCTGSPDEIVTFKVVY